jgi:DNA polymerase-3 subunit delta'
LPNAPHPRESRLMLGAEKAEQSFLEAYNSGRMHHAWILAGPEGVGKATFAYRAARFLLSRPQGATIQPAATLDLPDDHPVTRQILASSHPDLFVLRRMPSKDNIRKILSGNAKIGVPSDIIVEHARDALRIFNSTSGGDGWRVLIVDRADNLNESSSNALLKTIEEPPPRSVILMVTQAVGRLLPTIRSRCRVLPFSELRSSDIEEILRHSGEAPDEALNRHAAQTAHGSARLAFQRLNERTLAVGDHVRNVLAQLPDYSHSDVMSMSDGFGRKEGRADFDVMRDTVFDWLSEQIRQRAGEGPRSLAPFAEVWEKIDRAMRDVDAYNLDRRAFALTLFVDLAAAMRRSLAA